MNRWHKWWRQYDDLQWAWRWRIIGQFTRRLPGRWAAWQINREFARHDWGILKLIWAEAYLGWWVILNGWYELEDIQWGFCEIVRKPKTKQEAGQLARAYLTTWQREALNHIRESAGKEETDERS